MPSAEKDAPPVDALADLIDHWWQNTDQSTMYHDGVEYVASLALARFLVANGCRPIPPGGSDA